MSTDIGKVSKDILELIFEKVVEDRTNPYTLQTLRSIALTSKAFRNSVEKDSVWRAFVRGESIPIAVVDKKKLLQKHPEQTPVRLQVKELLVQADRVMQLIDKSAKKRSSNSYPLRDLSDRLSDMGKDGAVELVYDVHTILGDCCRSEDVPAIRVCARELIYEYKKQFAVYEKMGADCFKEVVGEVSIDKFPRLLENCLMRYITPFESLFSKNTRALEEFFDALGADHQVLELFLLVRNPYFYTNPLLLDLPEMFKPISNAYVNLKKLLSEEAAFITDCAVWLSHKSGSAVELQRAKISLYLMQKYTFYPDPKRVYGFYKNLTASLESWDKRSTKYINFCKAHDPLFAYYQQKYEEIYLK